MIIWKTGEPPQGVELLVEFIRCDKGVPTRKIIGIFRGSWLESTFLAPVVAPVVAWHVDNIAVLRWSTLDAAPDVSTLAKRFVAYIDRVAQAQDAGSANDMADSLLGIDTGVIRAEIQKLCGGSDGP